MLLAAPIPLSEKKSNKAACRLLKEEKQKAKAKTLGQHQSLRRSFSSKCHITIRQLWPMQGQNEPRTATAFQAAKCRQAHPFPIRQAPIRLFTFCIQHHIASRISKPSPSFLPLHAPFPEQGLSNPLTFIMSGCFCCAPHLLLIKNNNLSKVYLKSLWFIKHIFLQSVRVPLKGEQVQCQ